MTAKLFDSTVYETTYLPFRDQVLADVEHILLMQLLCDELYRGLVDIVNHHLV
jgi:hypothetical protein